METRQKVIEENLLLAEKFPLPLVRDFLRKEILSRELKETWGGPQAFVISQLQKLVATEAIPAEEFVDFIDALRENANQHVFLYRLPPEHTDCLKVLRAPEFLESLAKGKHTAACLARPPVVWDSPTPSLAAVTRTDGTRAALHFKWVETRVWHEMVQQGTNTDGYPMFIKQPRSGRSVSFCRIGLENGDCELRIERMPPNCAKSLREEVEIHVGLLNVLLEFRHFERVLIEPVISRLMTSRMAKIQSWSLELPEGGLSGDSNPTWLEKVGFLWRSFAGVELNAYWTLGKSETKIHSVLDGKKDYLTIFKHASPALLEEMIAQVRRLSDAKIENPRLRELMKKGIQAGAMLAKADLQMSRLGREQLDFRTLLDDGWHSRGEIERFARDLEARAPDDFNITWQVVCPETRHVVEGPDGPLSFPDYASIPETVSCLHPPPAGRVSHPTNGNLWPDIRFRGGKARVSPLRDGVARWMESPGLLAYLKHHFGKAVGEKFIKWIVQFIKWVALLALIAFYALFVLAITRAFVSLAEAYGRYEGAVFLSYLIVLLGAVGLLSLILGPEKVRKALKLIKGIIGILGDLLKKAGSA